MVTAGMQHLAGGMFAIVEDQFEHPCGALQLRGRGLSVADTALHCGYHSPSALTAALRRQSSSDKAN